jgi:hypothetical protein
MEREILQRLPRVLERDPQFTIWIEGLLAEKFPRRDELSRLLEEVKLLREETTRRFEQVDRRFEQVTFEMQTLRTDLSNHRQKLAIRPSGARVSARKAACTVSGFQWDSLSQSSHRGVRLGHPHQECPFPPSGGTLQQRNAAWEWCEEEKWNESVCLSLA